MRTIIPILVLLLCPLIGMAQQLPLFTQYREHQGILNPASIQSDYFVLEKKGSFGLSTRRQWTQQAGTPQTHTLQAAYIFDQSAVNMLVGGHLVHDRTGPISTTGLYARAAGIISTDPSYGGLVLGMNLGMVQYRLQLSEVIFDDPDDLKIQDYTQVYPDVGLGVFFYNTLYGGVFDGDTYYTGISMPQVLGLDLNFREENEEEFNIQRNRHYFFTAGFYKYLGYSTFLEPSIWVKYVPNAPLNMDVNLRYQMHENFWIGLGYSTSKAVNLETGFYLNENFGFERTTMKIHYGFSHYFNHYSSALGSTHEVGLVYLME